MKDDPRPEMREGQAFRKVGNRKGKGTNTESFDPRSTIVSFHTHRITLIAHIHGTRTLTHSIIHSSTQRHTHQHNNTLNNNTHSSQILRLLLQIPLIHRITLTLTHTH